MPSRDPEAEPAVSHMSDFLGNAELIGAIPAIFGFSLPAGIVVFTYHLGEPPRFGRAICVGLPGDHPEDIADKVASLESALNAIRPTATTVVIIDDSRGDMPRMPLAESLRRLHVVLGIRLLDVVWVPSVAPGAVWRSHTHAGNSGRVQRTTTSAVVATQVRAGQFHDTILNERASIAPDPDELLAARAALVDKRLRSTVSDTHLTDCARVKKSLDEAAEYPDEFTFSDATIARIAVALADPEVRDCCLLVTSTGAPGAKRLWRTLTRATPAPERAGPAVMLAIYHYARGAEHLADVAIDAALEAEPGNVLAAVLDRCRRAGITADVVRSHLAQAMGSKQLCSAWS